VAGKRCDRNGPFCAASPARGRFLLPARLARLHTHNVSQNRPGAIEAKCGFTRRAPTLSSTSMTPSSNHRRMRLGCLIANSLQRLVTVAVLLQSLYGYFIHIEHKLSWPSPAEHIINSADQLFHPRTTDSDCHDTLVLVRVLSFRVTCLASV
jgi:hypothetical protein